MWSRILLLGWPSVAAFVLVPLLKALDAPPSLAVAVYAIVATIAGALIVAYFDIPEEWLRTEDERDGHGKEQAPRAAR